MLKQNILFIFILTLLAATWEFAARYFVEYRFLLPPPSSVLVHIIDKFERFGMHTQRTVFEMLGGFILAFAVSFPLAWMMSAWTTANRILHPLFIVVQCIPMFTLAPLMVIWFGWSYLSIVIPTALMIFFPLTLNIYQGLKSTPLALMEYFRINQATPWQMFIKLQLPYSLPHLFAGIRIAAAIAGIGAIAGEWAGGQLGLGVLMLESRRSADLTTTFGALFCLTFITLSLYGCIASIEKRVLIRKKFQTSQAIVAGLLALSSVFVGGCSDSRTSNSRQTRLLLDWFPNPNHVPLYAGLEKGIFQQQGIQLNVLKIQDLSDSIPYLTSGQAELAFYYMPYTIRMNAKGANLVPVGILFPQPLNCFLYRKGEGIQNPEDLNGKIIGYCGDGMDAKLLNYLLENKRIVPKEKRLVNFDLVTALGAKQVDVLYGSCWNIESEHLRHLGVENGYFDLREFGFPGFYELIVLAKGGSPQTEPQFVEKFQKALQASIDYSVEHPDEAFDLYTKANPDKSRGTLAWEKKAWIETYPLLAKTQQIDSQLWESCEKWLRTHHFMDE